MWKVRELKTHMNYFEACTNSTGWVNKVAL